MSFQSKTYTDTRQKSRIDCNIGKMWKTDWKNLHRLDRCYQVTKDGIIWILSKKLTQGLQCGQDCGLMIDFVKCEFDSIFQLKYDLLKKIFSSARIMELEESTLNGRQKLDKSPESAILKLMTLHFLFSPTPDKNYFLTPDQLNCITICIKIKITLKAKKDMRAKSTFFIMKTLNIMTAYNIVNSIRMMYFYILLSYYIELNQTAVESNLHFTYHHQLGNS